MLQLPVLGWHNIPVTVICAPLFYCCPALHLSEGQELHKEEEDTILDGAILLT